jgi:hypothetical protein
MINERIMKICLLFYSFFFFMSRTICSAPPPVFVLKNHIDAFIDVPLPLLRRMNGVLYTTPYVFSLSVSLFLFSRVAAN